MVEAIENIMRGMLDVEERNKFTQEQLISMLAVHINQLLQINFEQLVNLLYRIDVSEKKTQAVAERFSQRGCRQYYCSIDCGKADGKNQQPQPV